jgi:F-type H+-transporting ATPase subunit epsilon
MARTVSLKILTPLGSVIDTEAEDVAAPGAVGEFGILPEHTPYLAALTSGILTYTSDGRKNVIAIRGGVAEVNDDQVVILTEETIFPEDIDLEDLKAREKVLKADLEEALDRGKPGDPIQEEIIFIELLRALAEQDLSGTE